MNNPFQFGQAVSPDEFIRPSDELLQLIIGRIINKGQAVAVVGEPRYGKTSLLCYLGSSQIVTAINSLRKDWRYSFRFMNAQLFQARNITIERFWKYAFKPIEDYILDCRNPELLTALQTCKLGNYDIFDIEDLLTAMKDNKIRLVLMIDEFDDLLNHPLFGTNEFLGGLRGLATHYESLAIIMTSRLPVSELNTKTKTIHTSTGSPYINYVMQVTLGAFTDRQVQVLLDRARINFTDVDRKFIVGVAGQHPYFLQIAAHVLFAAKSGKSGRPEEWYSLVWRILCDQAQSTLLDAWSYWSLRMKQVLAVIMLDDMPRLMGKSFDTTALRSFLQNCNPEIEYFETLGYIKKSSDHKYIIASQIVAWWYTRILIDALQSQNELGNWLLSEQRDGFLKAKQRDQIYKFGKSMVNLIDQNKDIFIKIFLDSMKK